MKDFSKKATLVYGIAALTLIIFIIFKITNQPDISGDWIFGSSFV